MTGDAISTADAPESQCSNLSFAGTKKPSGHEEIVISGVKDNRRRKNRTGNQMSGTRWTRITSYIAKSFEPHRIDAKLAPKQRAFFKWWLDLIRNLMIVGVVQYVADKSGHWYLKALSDFTYLVFVGYCMSYVTSWVFNPFHGFKSKRLQFWLGMFVGTLLPAALILAISFAVYISIDDIARVQGR
jgi:hypothetical protein